MVKELTAAEKAAAKEEAKAEAEAKAAEKAAAKPKGPRVYIFPGDDGIVMNEVTYTGGLKNDEGKERGELMVRVCGIQITLKKDVMALMSRSCQIVLGKIKQIKVERQAVD